MVILATALLFSPAHAKIEVEHKTDEFTGTETVFIFEPRGMFNNESVLVTYNATDDYMLLALVVILEDWKFLGTSAYDDQQRSLTIIDADHDMETLDIAGSLTIKITERVTIEIDQDWWQSLPPGDTRVKVFGDEGTHIFKISKKLKAAVRTEILPLPRPAAK